MKYLDQYVSKDHLISNILSFYGLIGLGLLTTLFAGCGPRAKSPEMVSLERVVTDRVRLQKLQRQSPDLINESLKHYELAKENESDEKLSQHYVKLAQITWQTAEMRALHMEHRANLSVVQSRRDSAQQLLNSALAKKKELSELKARQVRLFEQQTLAQTQQQQSNQQQEREQIEVALKEARRLRDEAVKLLAPELVPGPYKRAEMALRSAEATVQRGDFTNAIRIATGAQNDFKKASAVAQPLFEKRKLKDELENRMQRLLRESSQVRGADAAMEMRGVVVTLNGLFSQQKLTSRGRSILNEFAPIVERYKDLRIMIVGHTHSQGQHQAKLDRSEKMANQARDAILGMYSGITLNVVGRGDYVPIASNPRSAQNDRIDFVFFKPRLQ